MVTSSGQTTPTIQIYHPAAAKVYLLGEFNNWSTMATPMTHLGQGLWETVLPPKASAAHLRFFVWEQGQRFGRFMDPPGSRAASVA